MQYAAYVETLKRVRLTVWQWVTLALIAVTLTLVLATLIAWLTTYIGYPMALYVRWANAFTSVAGFVVMLAFGAAMITNLYGQIED